MTHRWFRFFLTFFICIPVLVQALSIDDLVSRGELQISTELSSSSTVLAKQQVQLWIDIKTKTWFAGGSRVVLPEVENVVVAQPNAFAINSSLKKAGTTWTVQRWALSLYPQQAGVVEVPPIAVQVAIEQGEGGIVTGTIYTAATSINVVLPQGERNTKGWLATPALSVERRFSPKGFTAQKGESLQLTVTSTADKLMPMMLPPYSLASIVGMAVYPQLPELEHKTQRGDNTAIRRDRFDIVIEQSGEYLIPAVEYRWWNAQLGEMQNLSLPALKLISGKGVVVQTNEQTAAVSFIAHLSVSLLKWFVLAVVLVLLGFVFWRYLYQKNSVAGHLSLRQLRKQIQHALKQGSAQQAVHYLYLWLDQYSSGYDVSGASGMSGGKCLREFADQLGDANFKIQLEAVLEAAYSNCAQARYTKPLQLTLPRKSCLLDRGHLGIGTLALGHLTLGNSTLDHSLNK